MAFTYHISLDDGVSFTEFFPSVKPKVTFQQIPDEIFLQPAIEDIKIGELLNPVVYPLISAMFYDSSTFGNFLRFVIRRDGTDTFMFRSTVSNGKIDAERKIFSIAPEPDDAYQDVIDKWENEYDIDSLLVDTLHPYIHVTNSFINVDFTTFTDISRTVNYTNTTGAISTSRLALTSAGLGNGDKIIVVIRNLSYTNLPPNINVANSIFGDISNIVEINADGIYTITLTSGTIAYIEFTQDAGDGDGTGSFDYEIYYYLVATNTRSLSLDDLIDDILGVGYMNIGLSMRSTFLFNDVLPPEAPTAIDTYITANPTHNYVTEAVNRFNDLHLAEVDGLTTDPADNHITTLKEILNILKSKLWCYWYIDTEGYLRIEHAQYFRTMAAQIDITSATYAPYKPEVDARLLSSDKSDSYSTIEYSENNADNVDFIADPIEYDYVKTGTKKKDVNVDISCDISFIINNPDDASADGFILAETEELSVSVPIFGASRTTGYYYQNHYLSWYSLFPIYWQYFGEADVAEINGGQWLVPDHTKEILRQTNIRFFHDGVLNWYQPVTLIHGAGWIKKMELDLSSGFYSLDVGFDPYNTVFLTDEDGYFITDEDGNLIVV